MKYILSFCDSCYATGIRFICGKNPVKCELNECGSFMAVTTVLDEELHFLY